MAVSFNLQNKVHAKLKCFTVGPYVSLNHNEICRSYMKMPHAWDWEISVMSQLIWHQMHLYWYPLFPLLYRLGKYKLDNLYNIFVEITIEGWHWSSNASKAYKTSFAVCIFQAGSKPGLGGEALRLSNPIPPGAVITPAFIPAVPAGKRSYILGMGELKEKCGGWRWVLGDEVIVIFLIIATTLTFTSPSGKNCVWGTGELEEKSGGWR